MRQRSRLLRRFVIWTGPIMAMALLVVGGFLYWVLATTPGIRWALVTAVMPVGGTVSGVSGSVWNGLQIGRLTLSMDQVNVDVTDIDLRVQWARLLDRQLHIQNFSVDYLDLALTQAEDTDESSDPFTMPVLPLEIRIDRLALGELSMRINGEPLPVSVGNLATALYLDPNHGQLRLNSLELGHEQADIRLEGDFQLLELNEPWQFDATVVADVQGNGPDSLLCARRVMPTLPQDVTVSELPETSDSSDTPDTPGMSDTESCLLEMTVAASGNMQNVVLDTTAHGQGLSLDANAHLTPDAAFPLKDARIDLVLPDQSSLQAQLDWTTGHGSPSLAEHDVIRDQITGTLQATRLNVSELAGGALPEALLTASGHFDVELLDRTRLSSSTLELNIDEGSIWNGESLHGLVQANIHTGESAAPDDATVVNGPAPQVDTATLDWRHLQLRDLLIDLQLGSSVVQASGGFGLPDSQLELAVNAPALSSFWPDLPGGIELAAQVGGAVSRHVVALDATYTPADSQPDTLGQAPARVQLDVEGAWRQIETPDAVQDGTPTFLEGWRGQINHLETQHAGLGLTLTQSPSLSVVPGSQAANGLWQLGRADIDLMLDGRPVLHLDHVASSGGAAGQWATAGHVERVVISENLIADIQQIISRAPGGDQANPDNDRGGVTIRGAERQVTEVELALDWDLRFEQALAGTLNARHLSGDVMVPSNPPFALGLQTFSLDVTATPQAGGVSQLSAETTIVTADMGRVDATVTSRLLATPGGLFELEMAGTKLVVDASIDDLGWVSLFAGDAMEFAGQLNANVTLTSLADGNWDSSGTITGNDLRIVRIDDGVRLLDGTLSARLENDRVILESLEFPALLRVEPKEWRTAEWVSTNPDARDGYLRLTGEWRLSELAGEVDVELFRYPVLQRADRYAMVTGDLHIDAALPALSITGRVEADAGWIDLDVLGGIPTVDGDVVVIRAGDDPQEVNVPMDLSMDIEVDLGPRVYLTGYGVNSGLVGNMRIMMIDNKLTAVGALRTRGGAIEAYGQRLQLRRGTITFQGDIASPVLSIEALRTGQPVEAGVRVSGTARRPAIDLVSYPDVADIEKLSWLLFGHGPDESGGDMALLLSVGTSFLGDGEPFYRKFGIDELSLQSGDIGSAGSILPAESVVSGLNSGASELERQFISASKGIAAGFTLSVRQALSDAGTVGRVSYRLARGLTAELSVGTVNGLALVYRWFSRD